MKHLSLQSKLTICILITSTALIVLSLYQLNRSWKESIRADEISRLSIRANFLILTLKDLTFERGRTNVVLSSGKPVTASDRTFIDTRRKEVDYNINNGLKWLAATDPRLFEDLNSMYFNFMKLRRKTDEVINSRKNSGLARYQIRDEWFKQSTELINKIIDIVETIAIKQNLPGTFENYYRYMIDTLEFRDSIGISGSIMTAAVSNGRKLTPEEYRSISGKLELADYLWSKIEVMTDIINDEDLNSRKIIVQHTYYELYRPVLEDTIRRAYRAPVSHSRVKQLKDLSVTAFDSVFTLKDQIKIEIGNEIKKLKDKAFISLVLASIQFLAALLVILATIIYFRNRLFKPLLNLTGALGKIRMGEDVPPLSDEIARPDEIGQLAEGVKMLEQSMSEERNLRKLTEIMAVTDELTGLYNRHFLEKSIDNVLTRSDRYNEPVTLAMFDLDHFKKINDKWGHPAGDAVLKNTSQIARQLIRSSDLLIRFGGEEFIVLMPHTSLNGGSAVAEKIREALEKNEHPGIGTVTASFGIAERQSSESFENWYARTDSALYHAKQSGRNRVECADSSQELVDKTETDKI